MHRILIRKPRPLFGVVCFAACLWVSCALDAAHELYMEALRGEETGMTRPEQIALIDRAILLSPERVSYWNTRAIYKIDLGQFDAAREDLERAIELKDRPYLRFLRGLVICQQGAPADALADFDMAIAAQPENLQFYRGRSLARAHSGDVEGALADADRLMQQASHVATSHYARGVARAADGRCDEAVADFTRVLEMRPELVYALEARLGCHDALGLLELADLDRAALEAARSRHASCRSCLDPYRY